MFSVSEELFDVCSAILVTRLTRPDTIDANIINPDRVDSKFALSKLHSRYIGCFSLRSDGDICFYLAARSHPEKAIDYLFVYYVNHCYTRIRESDVAALEPYLPYIDAGEDILKVGIINVKCSGHPLTYLSVLTEVVDYTIGSSLMSNFESVRYIDTDTRDLSIGLILNCNLDYCDGNPDIEMHKEFEELASKAKKSFKYIPNPPNGSLSDTNLVKIDGHLTGIFVNEDTNCVVHLLTHQNQYKNQDQYALMQSWINKQFKDRKLVHHCTRILPDSLVRCDSHTVWVAWIITILFEPHLLTVIRQSEINYFSGQPNNSLGSIVRPYDRSFKEYKPSIASRDVSVDSSSQSCLRFHSDGSRGCVVCNYDSQSTIIMERSDWQTDLRIWQDVSRKRRAIRDSIVPPTHVMRPWNDTTRSYLKLMPCYIDALKLMERVWKRIAPTVMFFKPVVGCETDCDEAKGVRFIIYAIESLIEAEDVIVVADMDQRKWIMLSGTNGEYKDEVRFFATKSLLNSFHELDGFEGKAVSISDVFHKECPRVHLLMALYVISRLFRYSVELPSRIIYGEHEFREYANNICAELQLVNAEDNIKNGLVDAQGSLLTGAKQSLPSPLLYHRSVVPKDVCMFCGKRNFNNLGRHMSMTHGKQAQFASKQRS